MSIIPEMHVFGQQTIARVVDELDPHSEQWGSYHIIPASVLFARDAPQLQSLPVDYEKADALVRD